MKMNIIYKLLLICFCVSTLKAQRPVQLHSSEILQSLKKLNTLGSVLYIAAHPDDENTRLLAYLANERKFRTGYLSLTRGDGGQNLIGKEQGDALGLIRTQELLAARRSDGAEQFFTRAHDFGFSKNPQETFSLWNHDSLLSDVVLCIRLFKPDVIICRFPTTGEGGHGHHTASAILALEAFDAAADSTKFSWQLKFTKAWKAKSIYWNTFNFGEINTTSPSQLKLDAGLYNPLLGKNYGEIAAESRSMHKSQGFGSLLERGSGTEYFKFLKGDSASKDLFEHLNTTWNRLPGGASIQKLLNACITSYKPEAPETSVKQLTNIYDLIKKLPDANAETVYWKKQKLTETENLILACGGIWLEALSADYITVPGQPITLSAHIINRSKGEVKLKQLWFGELGDTLMDLKLDNNQLFSFKRKLNLPNNTPYSNPYWLNAPRSNNLYTVGNANLIGKPQNPAAINLRFKLGINSHDFEIEREVQYKYSDPAKGEIYRPLEVLPPVVIQVPKNALVFNELAEKNIQLTVKANANAVSGKIEIAPVDGFLITVPTPNFTLKNKNDEALIDVVIKPLSLKARQSVQVKATVNNMAYTQSLRRMEYDHIPYQFILSNAQLILISIDHKKMGSKIGYIAGAGDEVEACLNQVGYKVTRLTDEMLAKGDLSGFDAIISGVRAYNINERLQVHYQRLMDYVANGGNLIVQYNTNNRIGPLEAKIGPYPFTISRERVTDEKAEVRFVNPEHRVLQQPNKISEDDFEGWVQERGTYFATETGGKYQSVFLMNDPGEKPLDGSLIIGSYGKGNFVYAGLAFFRQLPAGVPGAYRLLSNLIDLPENK
ncbi:MAG: PIG-L family deacetylase [Bacteroidia bacterium]|nr:PIG-L family deacetylase [Bacteroidia bacterium]